MIITNNPYRVKSLISKTNVVYEFTCPLGDCVPYQKHPSSSYTRHPSSSYIGHTRTTLSRRLTCHLSDQSAIKTHIKMHEPLHNNTHIRKILVDNTRILYKINCHIRLQITEALTIKLKYPTINNSLFNQGSGILNVFNN